MEDKQQMHMHMTEARRLSRPPKLKDTCDMCSTSKVRCDKMKPTCGRCERLGYQCSYSPARRMQKRRCIQCTQSSGNLAEAEAGEEEQLPDAAPSAAAATDGSAATDSYAPGDGAESSFRGAFNGGSFLQHQTTQPYTSNHSSTNKTNIHNNNSSGSSSSSRSSNFSTSEVTLPGLEYSKSIHANSDCVTVATNILEHLNTTHGVAAASFPTTQPKTPPPTNPETSIGSSASLAIKRISTILICPCSKNLDVGLLAAAVCAALLDTYEIILRKNNNNNSAKPHAASSSSSYSPSSNMNASRAAAAGPKRASTKPMMMHHHHRKASGRMMMMDSSDSSSAIDNNNNNADDSGRRDDDDDDNDDDDDYDEKATIMRIRDELPMVANLVAQFTRRYSQDAEVCSRDLLQGLALSITGRLSAMIDEVTNWMARI